MPADNPSPRPDYARLLADQASLRGRTAFVAGGYGGIGEAIAWGLALAGARVAVAGRSASKAEALATALGAAGHDAFGLAVGLTGAYASEWSLLSMYLLFIAVVTFRSRGLFGRKSVLDT